MRLKHLYRMLSFSLLVISPSLHAKSILKAETFGVLEKCVERAIVVDVEEGVNGIEECRHSRSLEMVCGKDGELTQLHAIKKLTSKVDDYQRRCEEKGGTIHLESGLEIENLDKNYCTPPQIVIGMDALEQTTCNMTSFCAPLTVHCDSADPTAYNNIPQITDLLTKK